MALQFVVYRLVEEEGQEDAILYDAGAPFDYGEGPEDIVDYCGLTAGHWGVALEDTLTGTASGVQFILVDVKKLCYFRKGT